MPSTFPSCHMHYHFVYTVATHRLPRNTHPLQTGCSTICGRQCWQLNCSRPFQVIVFGEGMYPGSWTKAGRYQVRTHHPILESQLESDSTRVPILVSDMSILAPAWSYRNPLHHIGHALRRLCRGWLVVCESYNIAGHGHVMRDLAQHPMYGGRTRCYFIQ